MNRQLFIWKFSTRIINTHSEFFAPEWVCRRDDIHESPKTLCNKTIWLVMMDRKRSYLFGHLVVEKIEKAKNGDERYILTTDPRGSFRVLPRDKDEWQKWALPRNGAGGIVTVSDSVIKQIHNLLKDNIDLPIRQSTKQKINIRAGNVEREYLRVLGENFYGDLARRQSHSITPYAALFDSDSQTNSTLLEMDARILHILRNGFCEPLRARAAPFVDTELRPADESKMFARDFVAGGTRKFSMDKTKKAEETHQQITRELCGVLRSHDLCPLYSRSIDLAVCVQKKLFIFEIKSANEKNFENQARGGIIQILEYKLAMDGLKNKASPVLVISSISSPAREEYIRTLAKSVGVAMVSHNPSPSEKFLGLDDLLC